MFIIMESVGGIRKQETYQYSRSKIVNPDK